jgi:hypothetical protein
VHRRGRTCKEKIQRAWGLTGGVSAERKVSLVEDNMTGDDNPSSCEVETPITLVRGGVSEKDTSCGARGQLVFGSGGEVGIAEATEYTKNSVVGGLVEELLIGDFMLNG